MSDETVREQLGELGVAGTDIVVGDLYDNIEETLRSIAEEYDVEVDEEEVVLVQDYIGKTVLEQGQHDDPLFSPEEGLRRVAFEMADTESKQARSNVFIAVGARSSESRALAEIAGATMKENYEQAGGTSHE